MIRLASAPAICATVCWSSFRSLPPDAIGLKEARLIVSEHLDLLANHDFRSLMRVTRLKEDVLKNAMQVIQSLDPRPGQSINTTEPEYVIPDVLVRKPTIAGRWN